MPFTSKGEIGQGKIMNAAVVATGVPVTSNNMAVGILDFVSFFFALTRVAATAVQWHFEGSDDGVTYYRLPVNLDNGTPPNTAHADGNNTRAQAVSGSWGHQNIRVTGLKSIRVVVDTTAGTTDTMDMFAYGEAVSAK